MITKAEVLQKIGLKEFVKTELKDMITIKHLYKEKLKKVGR